MKNIWLLIALTLIAGVLAACDTTDEPPACNCFTRRASAVAGAPLDTFVYYGLPDEKLEKYVDDLAFAEITFLSIKGGGVQVNMCNQHRLRVLADEDGTFNFGPELFAVAPGCALQMRCARGETIREGCEVEYRFRWLDK